MSSVDAAADQGYAVAVRSLIETQTTLDALEETTNHSSLQVAAKEDHLEVIEILIEEGASVNLIGGYFGKPRSLKLLKWLSFLRLQLTTDIT